VRVDELSVIAGYSFAFLRPGYVRADGFHCECDYRIVQISCSEEIRTQADNRPEIIYMEAAGDSCSEFLFHSRLISSISRKS
jgi:hypothetical protein